MLTFEETLSLLAIDPTALGLQVIARGDQHVDPQSPLLVSLDSPEAEAVLQRLQRYYPSSWGTRLVGPNGHVTEESVGAVLATGRQEGTWLFLPPLSWDQDLRSFATLMGIVARLRAPDGCPWDRAQTHESIARYLLEETYEVLEALDEGNMDELAGELGDVLLQVALHSQMAKEEGAFASEDVIEAVNAKLLRRHPHVFGDVVAETAEEVAANWEVIKTREKGRESLMDGVPATLPALTYSQRVQGRAAGVGFDAPDIAGVWATVHEEMAELAQARNDEERLAEIGDVLFALVNLGRRQGADVEGALRQGNRRFVERFQLMERLAGERGLDFPGLSLAEKDALWAEAKRLLS